MFPPPGPAALAVPIANLHPLITPFGRFDGHPSFVNFPMTKRLERVRNLLSMAIRSYGATFIYRLEAAVSTKGFL